MFDSQVQTAASHSVPAPPIGAELAAPAAEAAPTPAVAAGVSGESESTPLPFRGDTFLGICEAIGRDFGFHPNWLRIALSAGLLWSPEGMIGAYLGLGLLVALSRWLFPVQPAGSEQGAAGVTFDSPRPRERDRDSLPIAA